MRTGAAALRDSPRGRRRASIRYPSPVRAVYDPAMSRNHLDLVLVGVIFLALLLSAPDVLLFGSSVAWLVARRSDSLEGHRFARAAMWSGAALRLVVLGAVLSSAPSPGSALRDFLDAMLFWPRLTVTSISFIGLLTLAQTVALGYAVRTVVTRLRS